jgi:hypothetical protein
MSVRELSKKPDSMNHFPDDAKYRWLEMHHDGEVYGNAAIAEQGDALELHVTLTGWGSRIRKSMREDVKWLKNEAKRLGKRRIMGIRANGQGVFDPRLFKFAKLFGFTEEGVQNSVSASI